MADCFITRRGGGGSGGLNFEVVGGTTQPTNPKENTIWVNTNTDITSWVFSAAKPESSTEGLVWIELSQTPEVELNALKKNAIQLYLSTSMQYVSGEWVEKDALIYQNGEWVELSGNVYLFRNGNQYTEITGGWDGTATIDSDGLMYFAPASGANGLCTQKKVSKGNATKLCVNLTSLTGDNDFSVVLTKVYSSASDDAVIAYTDISKKGTHTIDLTDVTEDFYVYVYIWQTTSAKVDAIWFE